LVREKNNEKSRKKNNEKINEKKAYSGIALTKFN